MADDTPTTHPDEVFNAARRLGDPVARLAYLERACGDDTALRGRVEALLAAFEVAGSFLESPAADLGFGVISDGPAAAAAAVLREGPGTIVGRYKLLERIGEGGFGVVYMAEQTHPVRRKVALKLLKPGLDTGQVVARFEAERQALALMDHENIAKVLDAGATEAGRPFFVMELVHGVPITEFCDKNQLPPRARLELFVQVCRAVQHAHTKGIIHRDIKPTNVLVTLHEGAAVPKVIDFGIAKATGQQLTDKTLFTQFAQMVGTPLYMSPEQAEMTGIDVDTRSDIYSLGVLLYELMTGTTPVDKDRLKQAAFDEVRRIIREEEPPRPSTRVSTMGEQARTVSARRKSDPRRLGQLFRGELDWIVMKALEKDRARRYETANGFAADVQRYLADEPVQACPPSTTYRLRKFARRNKGPVLAAAAVVVALVAGIIGTTFGLVRAERRAAGERLAKQEAEQRQAETEAVLSFVEERVFAAARPEGVRGGLGHDVKLRQAVEAALPYLDQGFADRPLIEARLRLTLAQSFVHLGEAEAAAAQAEAARSLFTKHRGPRDPGTIKSMGALARSYDALGRAEDALTLREQGLALRKAVFGPHHEETFAGMHGLASSYEDFDRDTEALELRAEALALSKANFGPDHAHTITSMDELASSYVKLNRRDEAIELREKALALTKAKVGPGDPRMLMAMNNLANSYSAVGRHADAYDLYKEALPLFTALLGPDHPDTLAGMNNLADTYLELGRAADACKLAEAALPLFKGKLGPDHPRTLMVMSLLARAYHGLNRHDEGLKLREAALDLYKERYGPDHRDTLGAMEDVRFSYRALGRYDASLKLRQEKLALCTARLGPDHADTLGSMSNLAVSYHDLGRRDEALKLRQETLALMREKLPPGHAYTAITLNQLAESYCERGRRHVEAGRLPDALADFDTALALAPTDAAIWYRAAALFLSVGDADRYRGACGGLLDLAEKHEAAKNNPAFAGLAALACASAPDSVADFSRVERLAERSVRATEDHLLRRFFALAKGLAGFRGGRHDEALEWLQRCKPQADGAPFDASVFAATAMAHRGAGRTGEARVSLACAQDILAAKPADSMAHDGWDEWLRGETLFREAEGLVGTLSDEDVAAARQRQRDEELAVVTNDVQRHPGSAVALATRARWLLSHGRFAEAERDYARLVHVRPDDPWHWTFRGCVLAYLGREQEYREHCRAMLARFVDSTDPFALDVTTKVALLLPGEAGGDGDDMADLGRRAERLRRLAADSPWTALLVGLAELRAGRDKSAAEWLVKCTAAPHDDPPGQARTVAAEAYLAVARHHLGNAREAEAALLRAVRGAGALPPVDGRNLEQKWTGGLENWLVAHTALREAEAAVRGGQLPAPPHATGAPVPPPPVPTDPSPFGDKPAALPGVVQAEDFDEGGEGVAYHDTDGLETGAQPPGPRYRLEAVDLDVCNDEGGGLNIGGVFPGEWLGYTVNVEQAGAYDISVRLSAPGTGSKLHIEFAGKDATGPVDVPDTGAWGNWRTVTVKGVRLEAGPQVMRVVFDTATPSATNVCNLNWIEARRAQ